MARAPTYRDTHKLLSKLQFWFHCSLVFWFLKKNEEPIKNDDTGQLAEIALHGDKAPINAHPKMEWKTKES